MGNNVEIIGEKIKITVGNNVKSIMIIGDF